MHLLCDSCESRKDKTANKIATKLHNMETNIEVILIIPSAGN